VFDAAMLVALWQFQKVDLVAGLLLFRVLYYLVPFCIALTILGARELLFVRTTKAQLKSVRAADPLRSEIENENS
jgi:hypothetical protein